MGGLSEQPGPGSSMQSSQGHWGTLGQKGTALSSRVLFVPCEPAQLSLCSVRYVWPPPIPVFTSVSAVFSQTPRMLFSLSLSDVSVGMADHQRWG